MSSGKMKSEKTEESSLEGSTALAGRGVIIELTEALEWIEHHALQKGCDRESIKSVAKEALKNAGSGVQEASTTDPEIIEMIEMLKAWHEHRVNQLKQIIDACDETTIQLQSTDGKKIDLDSDVAKGVKVGANTALSMFTPFPIEITSVTEGEE